METLDLLAMRESYTRQRILLCFNGPISRSLIEEIGHALRNYMQAEQAHPSEAMDVDAVVDDEGRLDKAQLKAAYKEQLRRPRDSGVSSGAGLGLLDIARKSGMPLQTSLTEQPDGRAFFSLRAVI